MANALEMSWSAGRDMNALSGGSANGGDQRNNWGDMNGSSIRTGGGFMPVLMVGFVAVAIVGGVVWMRKK